MPVLPIKSRADQSALVQPASGLHRGPSPVIISDLKSADAPMPHLLRYDLNDAWAAWPDEGLGLASPLGIAAALESTCQGHHAHHRQPAQGKMGQRAPCVFLTMCFPICHQLL